MTSRHICGFLVLSCILASGCGAPSARDVWAKSLSRCADNDLLKQDKSKLLYLGPSNVFGPGSGWRIRIDGSLEPMWPLEHAAKKSTVEELKIMVKGNEVSCSDTRKDTFKISPNLLMQTVTIPLSGDAKADITSSIDSTVSITKWRQDSLDEIAFRKWTESPDSGTYGTDLKSEPLRRRVMKRAIAVTGFSATLVYDAKSFTTINAKYEQGKIYNIGGGATLENTANSTLTLSSPTEFYIVGTLLPINADGSFGMVSPEGKTPTEIELPSNQRVVPCTQPIAPKE